MSYLLSNLKSTDDKLEYTCDLILVNFKLTKSDVPFSSIGTYNKIPEISEDFIKSRLILYVNSVINNISVEGVSISVVEITLLKAEVSVLLNINDNIIPILLKDEKL